MFDNIGGKIKTFARLVCMIGITLSVIFGFIMVIREETFILGLIVIILGSLGSWIGSFMTYGFGQLIENSDILVNRLGNKDEKPNYAVNNYAMNNYTKTAEVPEHKWRCDVCGNMISEKVCPFCNKDEENSPL